LIVLAELAIVLLASLAYWGLARSRDPLAIFGRGVRRMLADRRYLVPFLGVVALPALDVLETRYDDAITAALGWDLTHLVHRLEGDAAAVFQRADALPVIWASAFAYIIVLPVLLAAPLVLAAAEERLGDFRALAAGIIANYVIAIPFYLLVPVKEMWAGNPGKVRLLLDEVSPAIMEAYRKNSALDNCFPSLHTSLAVTVAIIAARGERRPVAAGIWILATAVALSTLHLGIHWATDAAAGVILAAVCARIGFRMAGAGGRGPICGVCPRHSPPSRAKPPAREVDS